VSWAETTCEFWRAEIPRRARRWAAEDAARQQAWEAELHAAQARRAAEWPPERIRALMAEVNNG